MKQLNMNLPVTLEEYPREGSQQPTYRIFIGTASVANIHVREGDAGNLFKKGYPLHYDLMLNTWEKPPHGWLTHIKVNREMNFLSVEEAFDFFVNTLLTSENLSEDSYKAPKFYEE